RLGQVEALRFPVSGQILATVLDAAVFGYASGAADADDRCEFQLPVLGMADQQAHHPAKMIDRLVALRPVVAMAPELPVGNLRFAEILRLVTIEQDNTAADIRTADIDGDEAVVIPEGIPWQQLHATDQPASIGMMM